MEQGYTWSASLDSLPVALVSPENGDLSYSGRLPLGYADKEGQMYIYNHWDFTVKLGPAPNKAETYRVVAFEARPRSVDHDKRKHSGSKTPDVLSKDSIGDYLWNSGEGVESGASPPVDA